MKDIGTAPLPGEEYVEHGRDLEDSIALAKAFEEAGADAILIGYGSYDNFYWLYPPTYQKEGLWLEDAKLAQEWTFTLAGWSDGKATVVDGEGNEQTIEAETVVQAVGFTPNNALYNELEQTLTIPVWNIGDSKAPANVMESVHAGWFLAKNL